MTYSEIFIASVLTLSASIAAYVLVVSPKERKVLKKDEFQEFPLIQKTILSHNSGIYRFGLPRPNDTLGLPIGQHISIGANINGKEIVRSYTPTSLDSDSKGYFDLLIKAYPNGNISKLIANLDIGETIKVKGPKGFFVYTPNMVKSFGMVAGGTGITPMYQIIKAIIANPDDNTTVSLIYGNVNEEDILLRSELDKITKEHSNIKVFYVLDNPPKNWNGGSGYITPDILKAHLPAASLDSQLLICGPPPMVSAIKRAGVDLGFSKAKPVSKLGDQTFVF
ncbi:cytochrome-b5 reductase [Ascoidea rubescens DSM 1968]|uniref:NADH-cytochrome b5 reductase n=1 Tax=Ascoidea rubescens DSM 1968 TaxID=1344418 RepID=A0A1D2VS01_9ASCO|nr:microsomal cytochrome b reductase [Ascoidea rubescens DSM 1968]ODV64383.1 microsomal cytochrome b reductase [Ascoidea rubescens DSM 1968]